MPIATTNTNVLDRATGKIDRSIFSEQAIYDDEMEKIFGGAWLMIGHESLVPAVDDFFHTYLTSVHGRLDRTYWRAARFTWPDGR